MGQGLIPSWNIPKGFGSSRKLVGLCPCSRPRLCGTTQSCEGKGRIKFPAAQLSQLLQQQEKFIFPGLC